MAKYPSCVASDPGPLRTERLDNGRRRLLRDLNVELGGHSITVPVGFDTDFSSIPWFGRFVVRWSKVDIAGVVHDWLYAKGPLARREADDLWRLAARSGQYRANRVQAWLCWKALRWFGCCAWRGHWKSRDEAGKLRLTVNAEVAALGERLKELRDEKKLNVEQVAAKMGVRPAVVESLEVGGNPDVPLHTVYRYVSAIGAKVNVQ